MSDTDRPDINIVKTNGRAVGEGLRTLAADLVETVCLSVELITELFDKTAFIEMRPSFAMIVVSSAIGKERTTKCYRGPADV